MNCIEDSNAVRITCSVWNLISRKGLFGLAPNPFLFISIFQKFRQVGKRLLRVFH